MMTTIYPTSGKPLAQRLTLFCFLFFAGWLQVIAQPLQGNFTVGQPTSDFINLNVAIISLNNNGYTGSVTFLIEPGTYNWGSQGSILATAPGLITIRTLTGNEDVFIQTSASNFLLHITQADRVIIRDLSITNNTSGSSFKAIDAGEVADLTIDNCIFDLGSAGTAILVSGNYSSSISVCEIEDTEVSDGEYGIRFEGLDYSRISRCTLEDQDVAGIKVEESEQTNITDNEVLDFGGDGIFLDDCEDYHIWKNNVVTNVKPYNKGLRNGILLNDCLKGEGLESNALVQNNMVAVLGRHDADPGYGISVLGCLDTKLNHNSAQVHGRSSSGATWRLENSTKTTAYNNIISNITGDPAIIKNFCTSTEIDYTNYHQSSSASVFAILNSVNVASFSAWKTSTGHDDKSQEQLPGFTSTTDLHVCNTGLLFGDVGLALDDIDDESRNTPPYVGADEGTIPPAQLSVSYVSPCARQFTCIEPANATIYQWNFGDGSTAASFGNTVSHTYANNGVYAVTVTAHTSCGTVSKTIYLALFTCNSRLTGIDVLDDNAAPELEIGPNPADDRFNLHWNGPVADLSIYDLNGKPVLETTTRSLKSIDVQSWTPGVYFLRLQGDDFSETRKLVVRHQ